jgi:hypothetical protein
MASARVLPPSDHSQLEVDFPRAPDPPKGRPERHQSVVGLVCFVYFGCGISLLVLSRLFGCLFVCLLLSCFSMYGIMQPRSSAPKEGDDVMADSWVHAIAWILMARNGGGLVLVARVAAVTS